ncbi:thiamine diphosphokinase [Lachnospiraceae bacterium OttesenSCG-928-E19]|nr:thiamine diphosphokinase [Lachnospiraceae bacterium OttesenSCG-928-E19]
MTRETIIISGGVLEEEYILGELEQVDEKCIIGVDGGVKFLYENGIRPDHIVGDFDSLDAEIVKYYCEETDVLIHQFDPIKDKSDTEIAVQLAIEIGNDRIRILGATGARIDHLWANVQTLFIAYNAGVKAYIEDSLNRISVVSEKTVLKKSEAFGPFFSVFTIGGAVEHFNISGAKYPLIDHLLEPIGSLCVSNEYIEDVTITFPKGNVILMETRDRKELGR